MTSGSATGHRVALVSRLVPTRGTRTSRMSLLALPDGCVRLYSDCGVRFVDILLSSICVNSCVWRRKTTWDVCLCSTSSYFNICGRVVTRCTAHINGSSWGGNGADAEVPCFGDVTVPRDVRGTHTSVARRPRSAAAAAVSARDRLALIVHKEVLLCDKVSTWFTECRYDFLDTKAFIGHLGAQRYHTITLLRSWL